MSKLWNSSVEAKVAIVGVFYELEQLFAASNKTGTQLKEFSTLTGLSARELQTWQYAAQQAVGHSVDLASTFKGMQDSIKGMLGAQGGAPTMLSAMINALNKGGVKVDITEAKKWLEDPFLMAQRMQQFAQLKNVGKVWKTYILEGMHAGPDFIEALLLGGMTPGRLKAARPFTYSDAEVNQLTKASTAWANMESHIELAVGHFNALHGVKLAGDIEKIVDAVMRLTTALTVLADKVKVFTLLGQAADTVAGMINAITDLSEGNFKKAGTGIAGTVGRNADFLSFTTPFMRPLISYLQQQKANHEVNINTTVHTNTTNPKQHGDIVNKQVSRGINQTPTLMQNH